ncbi:phosphotransferase family protein [Arthrobacter sp. H14]|uniref:phosphotransferase family protein n=1 Tax=Arthrobacter sp. H14 TaxID=1312959 RepID=UPI0004B20873|nr:phosphotransferase [Arthrobacter sp. H14]
MFEYAKTAQRMPWVQLPAEVRRRLTGELGVPVEDVALAGGGFTHGFAAVLSGSGRSIFAKAAPASDTFIYPAYLREAAVLDVLPEGLPVPRLLTADSVEVGGAHPGIWQVLCFEAVHGYMPGAPWTESDLEAVHQSLVSVQSGLAGLPPGFTGGSMAEEFGEDASIRGVFGALERSGAAPSFIPALNSAQLGELQELCNFSYEALAGDAVLHNDLRADNIIIRTSDSKALFCDWNFLSTGPEWADWVALLLYVRPHGIDPGSWLQRSSLSASADPNHVDSWLAILGAYMIHHGSKPDMPTSPQLRPHGRFTAGLIIEWLAERRGWQL